VKPKKDKTNPYAHIESFLPAQPEYSDVKIEGLRYAGKLSLKGGLILALHGLTDSGKTTTALTLGKPFVVASEPATAERIGALGLRVPIMVATTYGEVVRATQRLPKLMRASGATTLVLDTYTTISDNIYVEVLNRVRDYYKPASSAADKIGIEHFEPKIEGNIWNEVFRLQNDLRHRFDGIARLGFSVIYVCHTKVRSSFNRGEDDSEGYPDAQGQFRTRLLRYPSATFYVERREVVDRVAHTKRDAVIMHTRTTPDGMQARCKWPAINRFEPAHIGRLIDKVRKHIEGRQ